MNADARTAGRCLTRHASSPAVFVASIALPRSHHKNEMGSHRHAFASVEFANAEQHTSCIASSGCSEGSPYMPVGKG